MEYLFTIILTLVVGGCRHTSTKSTANEVLSLRKPTAAQESFSCNWKEAHSKNFPQPPVDKIVAANLPNDFRVHSGCYDKILANNMYFESENRARGSKECVYTHTSDAGKYKIACPLVSGYEPSMEVIYVRSFTDVFGQSVEIFINKKGILSAEDNRSLKFTWEDAQKVCPKGTHLPTLREFLGLSVLQGAKGFSPDESSLLSKVRGCKPRSGYDNYDKQYKHVLFCDLDGKEDAIQFDLKGYKPPVYVGQYWTSTVYPQYNNGWVEWIPLLYNLATGDFSANRYRVRAYSSRPDGPALDITDLDEFAKRRENSNRNSDLYFVRCVGGPYELTPEPLAPPPTCEERNQAMRNLKDYITTSGNSALSASLKGRMGKNDYASGIIKRIDEVDRRYQGLDCPGDKPYQFPLFIDQMRRGAADVRGYQ